MLYRGKCLKLSIENLWKQTGTQVTGVEADIKLRTRTSWTVMSKSPSLLMPTFPTFLIERYWTLSFPPKIWHAAQGYPGWAFHISLYIVSRGDGLHEVERTDADHSRHN